MYVSNTDLLPPLFDQVLGYFESEQPKDKNTATKLPGALVRELIINSLESGIVNAAATGWRRRLSETPSLRERGDRAFQLRTSDRLSGEKHPVAIHSSDGLDQSVH